jgi:hypothetical protein
MSQEEQQTAEELYVGLIQQLRLGGKLTFAEALSLAGWTPQLLDRAEQAENKLRRIEGIAKLG